MNGMIDKMRVLFITIPFREYVAEISDVISKEINAQVDVIYCDLFPPMIGRVFDNLFKGKIKRWYDRKMQIKQFRKYERNKYDYIFVLVGRNVDAESLRQLCEKQIKTKKIIYLWDDVARVNTFKEVKNLFDEIYSFDTNDCRKYGFKFLPLFYCDYYSYHGEKKEYTFSCIGGLHSSREKYLKRFIAFCDKNNFLRFFHLQATIGGIIKDFIKGYRKSIPDFIKFKELSMQESSDVLKRSICAVDMPHPTQTGLTIRSIEALASHTKLITTNKAVKEYDFYNENNILVTDNECSNLTEEFVRRPYVKIDEEIMEKYSLNSWVRKIFKGD